MNAETETPSPGTNEKKRKSAMLVPTLIMGALALLLLAIAVKKGEDAHTKGLKSAGIMLLEVIPLLVFAFVIAGLVQELIPKESVARWVGGESGLRGILIGTLAGGLSPGGPYVSMPVAAGLLKAGAGAGTMVAYITGWSLWAFSRLPLEVGILGWKFTAVRMVCTAFFPPVAGLIAHLLFRDAL